MDPEAGLKNASRVTLATRRLKIAAHQTRRLVQWARHPAAFPAPVRTEEPLPHLLYSTRVPLASTAPDANPVFEAGKRHNVALAAPSCHGVTLTPDRPFSFWRTVGRVTESTGYRYGMELAGGCIVPAIGGGLCLLTRALFQAVLYADCEILERHGHSMIAVDPPAGVPWGIDATVYWPYVDLRFAPRGGRVRLSVRVRSGALLVSVTGDQPLQHRVELRATDERYTDETDGRIRHNRIQRTAISTDGRVLRTELVAVNRSRVISDAKKHRSCLTCDEQGCHARVEVPA